MPPDHRPSEQEFDISLLDVAALGSPDGLKIALRSIESVCFQADSAITEMIAALSSRAHLLEYVFSILNEKAYETLSRWIVSGFPTSATLSLTDTLSIKLLRRLSSSLLFAVYPSAADVPKDLHAFWRKVGHSLVILQGFEIDARTETREVYTNLLTELRGILEYYLLVLRQPLVSKIFKSSYMKVDRPPGLAFPTLQSMKPDSYMFSVSAREQEIIERTSSCYVIGAGKTTTMLFKMLGVERTWKMYPDMGPKPRQVFVNQSRALATKVEEQFIKLMGCLEPATTEDTDQRVRLVDQDDNCHWRPDLPDKFSELSEENFPLFITYDRLWTMLQNDIREENDNDGFIIPMTPVVENTAVSPRGPVSPVKSRLRAGSRGAPSSEHKQKFRRGFVSCGEFLTSYWVHLPQTSTRVLDPASVFGEIMGVIKGSEEAVGTQHRCLDRETYRSLSCRTQGTFARKRDEIYDLFLAYTKLKRQRQDYDAADRTHYILKELRDVGLKGRKVDFLYADEVQDNLLIDTLVLRTLCDNHDGLFWAGDPARTISVGGSFRFTNLKAYQHRIEKQLSQQSGLTPTGPQAFELAVNYRSRSGIVDCAQSVIELIMRYWPHSIDPLKPEKAVISGVTPTFYCDQGDGDLEKSFFRTNGKAVGFGILVRNDAAKERLQAKIGKSLIMTLHNSKGLEFDDVLLYNFFEDSTATLSQWRLVLNDVDQMGCNHKAPVFDDTRHANICLELKLLYVAITRAKSNLWILDNSGIAEPMKVFWRARKQVRISSFTSEIASLAVLSTAEEWAKSGEYFFLNKHYDQASIAFQRADRPHEAAVCNAYSLREKARSQPSTAGVSREKAFIEAAVAFNSCAQTTPLELVDERQAYYRNAGECFLEGRKPGEARKSYAKAEQCTPASHA